MFFICSSLWPQKEEKKTLTTRSFESLHVYYNLDVKLIESDFNKVVAYGQNSDFLILTLKDNTLKIRLSGPVLLSDSKTKIDLYHSMPLDHIIVSRGSFLTASQPINQNSLSLEAKINAVISLELYVESLNTKVSLGGRVHLKGKAATHNLKLLTDGVCESEQLQSDQTKIISKGGAYAYVSSKSLLEAKIFGGVLRVFGNPTKQISQVSLGGKIYVEEY